MTLELSEEQVEMVRSALRSHRKYLEGLSNIEGTGTLKAVYESISKMAVQEQRVLAELDTQVRDALLHERRKLEIA